MILGLALTLAYVPGWTGAFIQTGWVVLSFVLPWTLWKGVDLSPFHFVGLTFLCYAALGLLWAPSVEDGIWVLWTLTLFALAFRWAPLVDLPRLYRGLALGLGVSSIFAILQAFRIGPVLQTTIERSSGLFYSPVVLGSVCALVILGLLSERLWVWVPLAIPALVLSGSRGAWVALTLGMASRWIGAWVLLGLIPVILFICFSPSEIERATIWFATLRDLSFLGHGPGSMADLYVLVQGHPTHPGFAHNEVLDLLYQFGLPAVLLLWMATVILDTKHAPEYPVYIAFLVLAMYFGPLHHPVLGFIGAIVAGRLAIRHGLARRDSAIRGSHRYPRRADGELSSYPHRADHLPI